MRRTEDTIRQREVVSRTAQKRAPITAHGSSGCYTDNEKPFVFGIIKALLEKKNFIYEQK
jgi:hypothetical protein